MSSANPSTPLILRAQTSLFRPFPNPVLMWKTGALLSGSPFRPFPSNQAHLSYEATLGIINGAFGAHALKKVVTQADKLQAWNTASQYAFINGVALLAISTHSKFSFHRFSGPAIGLGTLLFSASIWALTLDREQRFRWMGPVTPLGGALMILGYFSLIF